jgi:hypothetical protein
MFATVGKFDGGKIFLSLPYEIATILLNEYVYQ